jgi:hypothetical protein
LERMILFGEGSLRRAIHELLAHYHHERNHQGLRNRLIIEEKPRTDKTGVVQCHQRLGRMLNYYYRQAACSRCLNLPSKKLTGKMLLVSCGQRPFLELAISNAAG